MICWPMQQLIFKIMCTFFQRFDQGIPAEFNGRAEGPIAGPAGGWGGPCRGQQGAA